MIEIITESQTFDLHYAADQYHIQGQQLDPVITQVGEFEWQILLNGNSYTVFLHQVDRENKTVRLTINGKSIEVGIRSRAAKLLQELGIADKFQKKTDSVKAPMPGLIHSVSTTVGAIVKKGEPLLILEAMKMENIIKSPGDGVISRIHVAEKDSVNKNALLVSFE